MPYHRGMILPLALLLLASPAQPSSAATELWLGRSAELALACVHKEYPNKIAHVLNGDTDVRAPHELTPAFYGCTTGIRPCTATGSWRASRASTETRRLPPARERH